LRQVKRLSRNARLVRAATVSLEEQTMLDLILVATGLGFFALSIGYAYGCDRL
jgi:hypothetical protein